MVTHDLVTMYSAKAIEYGIAIAYLLLFIPYWRFVTARPAPAAARQPARPVLGQVADWFRLPLDLYYHPGHAWARPEGDVVTIGIDDFGRKLVGPAALRLPPLGARLAQGEPALALEADSKAIDVLAPVDGTVIAVNERALGAADPYGDGWLLKVRAPRLPANLRTLLSGSLARRWMEDVCDTLCGQLQPDLGRVYQDGGLPVDGIARALEPDNWDGVAKRFFLTDGGGTHA